MSDKLEQIVGAYLTDLRDKRGLGAGTPERSYYPAVAALLDAIGAELRPKVLCLSDLGNPMKWHTCRRWCAGSPPCCCSARPSTLTTLPRNRMPWPGAKVGRSWPRKETAAPAPPLLLREEVTKRKVYFAFHPACCVAAARACVASTSRSRPRAALMM